MKSIYLLGILLTGSVLFAENIIKNGDFSNQLNFWTVKSPYKIDKDNFVSSPVSVKLSTDKINRSRWLIRDIELEPDTVYELSFYMKGEALTPDAKLSAKMQRASGAGVGLNQGRKSLSYGLKGLWKYGQGTFDWTFAKFQFNSKFFKAGKITLKLFIIRATGSVWFDDIKLRKVTPENKISFKFEIFPLNFIESTPYTICENVPGNLILTNKANGSYTGKKGSMILELPQFISLGGVVPAHATKMNEKYAYRPQSIKKKSIVRDGKKYNRYEIKFDRYFSIWMGKGWYNQNIFLVADKGTVGQRGFLYWSVKVGNEKQKEQRAQIEVISPIKDESTTCKHFQFFTANSPSVLSTIPKIAESSSKFWRSLVKKPLRFRKSKQTACKGFKDYIMAGGNDLLFPFPNSRNAYQKMHDKKLKNQFIMDTEGYYLIANWYKLEDPNKLFENYLRSAIHEWRQKAPDIKNVVWDFEPGAKGFDKGGRARFAKLTKLAHTPTVQEIKGKYKQQWFKYMVQLHADYIKKIVQIFRSEYPDVKLWLCTDPLHAGKNRLAEWCAVDASLSDAVIDGHMHMPYYCGVRYFDDIKLNIETLKKPFLALNDPAERMIAYFRRYTPVKLKQNIIATAALGGIGFGLWPNDALPGDYLKEIAAAYQSIAKVEDFYFDGKRADKEFSFKAKNSLSKEVQSESGRKTLITFPDFSRTFRSVVHKKQDKYIFTLFNYDDKNTLISEVTGAGLKFLVKIPPNEVKIVDSSKLPAQNSLQKELENFQKKSSGKDIFRELKSGQSAIYWGANNKGVPLLKMNNNVFRTGIDALGTGEMISLKNRSGSEMLQDGFLGRLVFYDVKQYPCSFIIENMQINDNVPSVVMKAVVPPFEGANPEINPLMDLECSREFVLKKNEVEVTLTFKNPTKKIMRFGFRVNNLPQPGKRFAKRQLTVNVAKNKLDYKSPMNNLFLRSGMKIDFMPSTKAKIWTGEVITAKAQEGGLSDTMAFEPGPGFAGIYCWNGHGMITVELLSPTVMLKPDESKQFKYNVKL